MTATASDPGVGVVGAVVPDPRRPGSVRVIVAGRPFCTVAREVVEAERVVPGAVLVPALMERLERAADEEAAFRTALRLLERRPFARRDLVRRLGLKGHPPAAAEAAVGRAEGAGLVDDARFAGGYVETRQARGRGPLRIRRDLAAMGVERHLIDAALAEAFPPDAPDAAGVEALARRRLAQLRGLPRPVARRRLVAFLSRRGFAGAEVHRVLGLLLRVPAAP